MSILNNSKKISPNFKKIRCSKNNKETCIVYLWYFSLEKYFCEKKNSKKFQNWTVLNFETLSKAQFSTFFIFSFCKIIVIMHTFILNSKTCQKLFPSILFSKKHKNRRIYEKNAEKPQNLSDTKFLTPNSRSVIKKESEKFY